MRSEKEIKKELEERDGLSVAKVIEKYDIDVAENDGWIEALKWALGKKE